MKRRSFLAALALAPAVVAAGCKSKQPAQGAVYSPEPPTPPPEDGCTVARRDAGTARVLTAAQWNALDAACERLLPRDQDPGASEAGVVNYIDAQLVYPPISSFRPLLQAGAQELDRLAASRGKRRFSELPSDEQDSLLTGIQRSRMGQYSGGRFFEVLLALTLEGFFSDPVYGGNRDGVGWKMIKLQPRSPGASCVYRGIG